MRVIKLRFTTDVSRLQLRRCAVTEMSRGANPRVASALLPLVFRSSSSRSEGC